MVPHVATATVVLTGVSRTSMGQWAGLVTAYGFASEGTAVCHP
jgi:hypothetical protein